MELEYDFFPLIAGELGASRDSSKQLQSHLDEFLPVYKVHVIAGRLIDCTQRDSEQGRKTAVFRVKLGQTEHVFAICTVVLKLLREQN